MEKLKTEYCRLCAEHRNPDKLLDLEKDQNKYEEIVLKLEFIHAFYVDISNSDHLPKTVCLMCCTALNQVYDFLKSVKRAQDTLHCMFSSLQLVKGELLEDKKSTAITESTEEIFELKLEVVPTTACHSMDESINFKKEQQVEIGLFGPPQDVNIESSNDDECTDSCEKTIKTWGDYSWNCSQCDMEFAKLNELRSHAKLKHFKCAVFMCLDCGEHRKKDFGSFVKHVSIHWRALRTCCYYCFAQLDTVDDLSTHITQHFQSLQVACTLCAEILDDNKELYDHLLEYKPEEPEPNARLMQIKRKQRGIPLLTEDLTCRICNNVFKTRNSLWVHVRRHERKEGRNEERREKRLEETKEKKYGEKKEKGHEVRKRDHVCDHCGKSFFSKGSLSNHILIHENKRPHVCHICNKAFIFARRLRDHISTHSDDKPFSCEQCGKGFRLKCQLTNHKIIHTDLMPYSCQYCNRAFRFKNLLKTHQLQHTGVKPYSCELCGRLFTNWSNYNKHMKKLHEMDISKRKKKIVLVNSLETVHEPVEQTKSIVQWKEKMKDGNKLRVKSDLYPT